MTNQSLLEYLMDVPTAENRGESLSEVVSKKRLRNILQLFTKYFLND